MGTESSPSQFFRLNEIIAEQTAANRSLIAILQAVQEEYRYLPEEVLTYIATALNLSPATVFGVATFFAQFSLEPKGRHLVSICDGTACHVKGSMAIFDAICRKYDLKEGRLTTQDRLFTLEKVACVGACGLAPVMVINGKTYGQVSPEEAVAIIDKLRKEK